MSFVIKYLDKDHEIRNLICLNKESYKLLKKDYLKQALFYSS